MLEIFLKRIKMEAKYSLLKNGAIIVGGIVMGAVGGRFLY